MKVILIEEDRFIDLTNKLKLVYAESHNRLPHFLEQNETNKAVWRTAIDEAQRRMHYEFVNWAQSHGASCVPKY